MAEAESGSTSPNGRAIYIIGGGITGLLSAWEAARLGYHVVLFESKSRTALESTALSGHIIGSWDRWKRFDSFYELPTTVVRSIRSLIRHSAPKLWLDDVLFEPLNNYLMEFKGPKLIKIPQFTLKRQPLSRSAASEQHDHSDILLHNASNLRLSAQGARDLLYWKWLHHVSRYKCEVKAAYLLGEILYSDLQLNERDMEMFMQEALVMSQQYFRDIMNTEDFRISRQHVKCIHGLSVNNPENKGQQKLKLTSELKADWRWLRKVFDPPQQVTKSRNNFLALDLNVFCRELTDILADKYGVQIVYDTKVTGFVVEKCATRHFSLATKYIGKLKSYVSGNATDIVSKERFRVTGLVTSIGTVPLYINPDTEAADPDFAPPVLIAGGASTLEMAAQLNVYLPIYPANGASVLFSLSQSGSRDNKGGQLYTAMMPLRDKVDVPVAYCAYRDDKLVVSRAGTALTATGRTLEFNGARAKTCSPPVVLDVLSRTAQMFPRLIDAGGRCAVVTGSCLLSADGLPAVGKLHGIANTFVCVPVGLYGLTLSPFLAKLAVAELHNHHHGHRNDDSTPKLTERGGREFDPMRFSTRSILTKYFFSGFFWALSFFHPVPTAVKFGPSLQWRNG